MLTSPAATLHAKATNAQHQAEPAQAPSGVAAYALAAIVVCGLALRLAILPLHGYEHDVKIFVGWAHILMRYGTHGLYGREEPFAHTALNYPPGYAVQLFVVTSIDRLLQPYAGSRGDALLVALLKIPAILADLIATLLAFAIVRRWTSRSLALVAAAIAAFGPWTWPVSAYWGQVDSLSAMFLLLAFYLALRERFTLCWLALAASILIKPFGIVVIPVLLALQYARTGRWARLGLGPLAAIGLAYLTALPFAPNAAPLAAFAWLAQQYASGQALFPMTSVDAYNAWLAVAPAMPDMQRAFGLRLQTWGWLGFATFDTAITIAFVRSYASERITSQREQSLAIAWFLALLGLFMFATRMHERYVIFALAFAPMLYVCGRWERRAVIILALTFTANVVLSLLYKHVPEIVLLTRGISLVNVSTLAIVAARFFWRGRPLGERTPAPAPRGG